MPKEAYLLGSWRQKDPLEIGNETSDTVSFEVGCNIGYADLYKTHVVIIMQKLHSDRIPLQITINAIAGRHYYPLLISTTLRQRVEYSITNNSHHHIIHIIMIYSHKRSNFPALIHLASWSNSCPVFVQSRQLEFVCSKQFSDSKQGCSNGWSKNMKTQVFTNLII